MKELQILEMASKVALVWLPRVAVQPQAQVQRSVMWAISSSHLEMAKGMPVALGQDEAHGATAGHPARDDVGLASLVPSSLTALEPQRSCPG